MPHESTLVATLAIGFGLAIVLGFLAVKIRVPALVGYLLAGIAIGPHTRGFVGDVNLAAQLAEVGVILLMFGVGLHFSVEALATVRRVVTAGALIQIAVAAAAGFVVATLWGWTAGGALVFGLSLSVSSTVVLLRALESRHLLTTFNGRLAIAWLVVQDLIMVLLLVLVPALPLGGIAASPVAGHGIATTLAVTVAKVAAFIGLMFAVGRRLFPRILWMVATTGSRELFTLCVIAGAVGVAYASSRLFGVSFALGAFFAGMMLRESDLSHRAGEASLPLQDAFAALFFLSVGMLFDPAVLVAQPLRVLAAVAVIMIANPASAIVVVLLFRYPAGTALTVGAALTQIGEFSFILAGLGVSLGLLTHEAYNLILAAALITIALNPLVFAAADRTGRHFAGRATATSDPLSELPMSTDPSLLSDHVVLVGYGRVGRRISQSLAAKRISYVVVEQSREIVERLRHAGVPAVCGDAADTAVLLQGHVARARMLAIATPDPAQVRKMIETARILNPRIHIVVRTHSDDEAELLRREHLDGVFMGEHELAAAMTERILMRMAGVAVRPEAAAQATNFDTNATP